jgi:hypothetical protein
MAEAVTRALDPEAGARIGAAARLRAEQFSTDRMAASIAALFDGVVRQP